MSGEGYGISSLGKSISRGIILHGSPEKECPWRWSRWRKGIKRSLGTGLLSAVQFYPARFGKAGLLEDTLKDTDRNIAGMLRNGDTMAMGVSIAGMTAGLSTPLKTRTLEFMNDGSHP
jgi:hypothetical protein